MHKDLILEKIKLNHDSVEISRHEDASNLVTQGLIFDSILHLGVLAAQLQGIAKKIWFNIIYIQLNDN